MFCSNCGKELKEKTNYCSDCGYKLEREDQPYSDTNLLNNPVNYENKKFEFNWNYNSTLILDEEKAYLKPPKSKFYKFILGDLALEFPTVYFRDLQSVSYKYAGAIRAGRIDFLLKNGKTISYRLEGENSRDTRNEAAYTIAKIVNDRITSDNYNSPPNIGSARETNIEPDITDKIQPSTSETDSKKEWHQTNWVWVWLILFWPVGVYGLIKRAEPEHRKFWWGGFIVVFLLILEINAPTTSYKTASSESVVSTGVWYDDVGSPKYLDAQLTISKDPSSGTYSLRRVNGDNSQGYFKLRKSGNKLYVENNKFGSFYIITNKGLEIHDRAGYIRTARPVKL